MWQSSPITATKFFFESVLRYPSELPEFSLMVPLMAIVAQHFGRHSIKGAYHAFEQDSIGLTGY
jgi:hypothetical protein